MPGYVQSYAPTVPCVATYPNPLILFCADIISHLAQLLCGDNLRQLLTKTVASLSNIVTPCQKKCLSNPVRAREESYGRSLFLCFCPSLDHLGRF